jgi:hypothetical protein
MAAMSSACTLVTAITVHVEDHCRGNRRYVACSAMRRSIVVAGASAAIGCIVVAALSLVSPRGVAGLVHAAPPLTDRSAPQSLPLAPPDKAFDGQFYYRMAVAPLSTSARVAGVRFDIPALRHERIGYSALAWVATLGRRDQVPRGLVAVNIVAMFALGWLGAIVARSFGRNEWWGLLFPLFPGFVYSLGFDLAEIVAAAFALGAVVALMRRNAWAAALLASAAVLTRETAAVLPLALVADAAWARLRREEPQRVRIGAVAGGVPLAVLVAWQLWLRSQWDRLPLTSSADKNVRLPFQGLWDAHAKFFPPTHGATLFRDVSLVFLAVVFACACVCLARSTAPRFVKIAWTFGTIVVVLLSSAPWAGATSFVRAATEPFLYGVIVVLGDPTRRRVRVPDVVAVATMSMFALTFVSEIGKART